ncbi:hypothetical protein FOL47_000415, partial [Perkinsus chesapeaki]
MDLPLADQGAISRFLEEFSGYLDPSSWRSRWSRSCSEVCGPRTNNQVERFNKELKKCLLPSRSRLSLHEFVTFLRSEGDWAAIAQYGRDDVRGQPNQKVKDEAAQHFARQTFCGIPSTWCLAGQSDSECAPAIEKWIFLTKAKDSTLQDKSMLEHIQEPEARAKKFHGSTYVSLSEAHRVKKMYSMVGYLQSGESHSLHDLWCTCTTWLRETVCSHTLCIHHQTSEAGSPANDIYWKTANCKFKRPKQRRTGQGQFDDNSLPHNARYGLNPRRKKNEAASTQRRSRRQAPPRETPSACPSSAVSEGHTIEQHEPAGDPKVTVAFTEGLSASSRQPPFIPTAEEGAMFGGESEEPYNSNYTSPK